jgi:hypothetical protein
MTRKEGMKHFINILKEKNLIFQECIKDQKCSIAGYVSFIQIILY